ncbi:adenosylcobinamide-phosphate synthase CbiB [Oceanobacter mangrovi]|uniref:adenosylcobinamide-phosphate synthase CbiB n=1 Tax=Oceanobacter mangrovi TaxID=2862510 RepID=UPI001C8D4EF9|nr:adenosylcobinamide-phosphate synthase CbiB [Oceanobacter mangrovi]
MFSIYWLTAFLLDLKLGDPHHWPHPVVLIGKLIQRLQQQLLKPEHTPQQQKLAGVALWLIVVVGAWLAGLLLIWLSSLISSWLAVAVQIALAYQLLASRSLADAAKAVFEALESGSLAQSREKLSWIVGRDTSQLNEEQIARATVETVAENTVDGVIAPLFWLFIGGVPAMLAYKAVNTLDSMIGYQNDQYRHFGYASAKLDDLANWLPARLSWPLFTLAAALLRLDWQAAWRIGWRDRHQHKSPNCAWSEASAAGALGIRMGGPNVYFGQLVEKPWIGDGDRTVNPSDILLAIQLMYLASALALGLFIVLTAMI